MWSFSDNGSVCGVLFIATFALLFHFFYPCFFSTLANEAAIGRCYEPSEQVPHGGMVFDYGEKIPFYNPGEYLALFHFDREL